MRNILLFISCFLAVGLTATASPIRSNVAIRETNTASERSKLPDGVIAVEYIQSSGTQYINTGITPQGDGISRIFLKALEGNTRMWGCVSFVERQGYGRYFCALGVANTAVRQKNTFYDILVDGIQKQYIVNDEIIDVPNFFAGSASGYCWLFGASDRNEKGRCQIYFAYFTDKNKTFIRNFIPVRFLNESGEWEGAMYDSVTKQLFRNSGTGNFIIGPDKE